MDERKQVGCGSNCGGYQNSYNKVKEENSNDSEWYRRARVKSISAAIRF